MKTLESKGISIPVIDQAVLYLPDTPSLLIHYLSEDKIHNLSENDEMPIMYGNTDNPYFRMLRIEGSANMTDKHHPIYQANRKFNGPELVVEVSSLHATIFVWTPIELKIDSNFLMDRYQVIIPNGKYKEDFNEGYIIIGKDNCINQVNIWKEKYHDAWNIKHPSIDNLLNGRN